MRVDAILLCVFSFVVTLAIVSWGRGGSSSSSSGGGDSGAAARARQAASSSPPSTLLPPTASPAAPSNESTASPPLLHPACRRPRRRDDITAPLKQSDSNAMQEGGEEDKNVLRVSHATHRLQFTLPVSERRRTLSRPTRCRFEPSARDGGARYWFWVVDCAIVVDATTATTKSVNKIVRRLARVLQHLRGESVWSQAFPIVVLVGAAAAATTTTAPSSSRLYREVYEQFVTSAKFERVSVLAFSSFSDVEQKEGGVRRRKMRSELMEFVSSKLKQYSDILLLDFRIRLEHKAPSPVFLFEQLIYFDFAFVPLPPALQARGGDAAALEEQLLNPYVFAFRNRNSKVRLLFAASGGGGGGDNNDNDDTSVVANAKDYSSSSNATAAFLNAAQVMRASLRAFPSLRFTTLAMYYAVAALRQRQGGDSSGNFLPSSSCYGSNEKFVNSLWI